MQRHHRRSGGVRQFTGARRRRERHAGPRVRTDGDESFGMPSDRGEGTGRHGPVAAEGDEELRRGRVRAQAALMIDPVVGLA